MKKYTCSLILFLQFVVLLGQSHDKKLIIRVDDMGCTHATNLGIMEAFNNENSIATSVEVMVPTPWFPEAVQMLKENPTLDVGLHLVLTSEWTNLKWRPLTKASSIIDENGYFYPMIWPNDKMPKGTALIEHNFLLDDIENEIRAQIELGLKEIPQISHISAHMGWSNLNDSTKKLYRNLAKEYGLDILLEDLNVKRLDYKGEKSMEVGQRVEKFILALEKMTPGTYIYVEHPAINSKEQQALSHPGYEDVADDRERVLKMLTDPRVKKAIKKNNISLVSYQDLSPKVKANKARIPILIDSDANNELDDQHALAYAFFNRDIFDIKGVTVNSTINGGGIQGQYDEAKRVMQLCNVWGEIPLLKGAEKNFEDIKGHLNDADFDGKEGVDFIIEHALKHKNGKLVLVPIGKLTNIALALKKAPEIKDKIRIVWLGSNFPDTGEYNLDNDIPSVNYVVRQNVPIEMVLVRYGKPNGTATVRITPKMVTDKIQGKGPKVEPVTGRHGGSFTNFGDYSKDLFSHIELNGNPPSRPMYDMVALAVLKNPHWGEKRRVGEVFMENSIWVNGKDATKEVFIWENFDKDPILEDFISSLDQ